MPVTNVPGEEDLLVDRMSPDELKCAINNFLWSHLPSTTTLAQADEIAVRWFIDLKTAYTEANVRS
jgi:hypothetical protein